MSADLEETLDNLDVYCRDVIAKLKSLKEIEVPQKSSFFSWAKIAALFFLILVLGVMVVSRLSLFSIKDEALCSTNPYLLAYSNSKAAEYEIVRTQHEDGSWGSDYLTRQNAAILRILSPNAVAYRKAMRYLKSRGLKALTDEELSERRNFLILYI